MLCSSQLTIEILVILLCFHSDIWIGMSIGKYKFSDDFIVAKWWWERETEEIRLEQKQETRKTNETRRNKMRRQEKKKCAKLLLKCCTLLSNKYENAIGRWLLCVCTIESPFLQVEDVSNDHEMDATKSTRNICRSINWCSAWHVSLCYWIWSMICLHAVHRPVSPIPHNRTSNTRRKMPHVSIIDETCIDDVTLRCSLGRPDRHLCEFIRFSYWRAQHILSVVEMNSHWLSFDCDDANHRIEFIAID